jgi:hypothetical protein
MNKKRSRIGLVAAIAGLAMLAMTAAGCHRLVAPPGETAVLIFPDHETATKVAQMVKEQGMLGAIAALGETAKPRPVLVGTYVKVLSSDDYSVEVVVTRGPYKGLHGYVLKDAVK